MHRITEAEKDTNHLSDINLTPQNPTETSYSAQRFYLENMEGLKLDVGTLVS